MRVDIVWLFDGACLGLLHSAYRNYPLDDHEADATNWQAVQLSASSHSSKALFCKEKVDRNRSFCEHDRFPMLALYARQAEKDKRHKAVANSLHDSSLNA